MVSRGKRGKVPTSLRGMLVVNKEAGPSSNRVVQDLRRALGGVKAGHAGTLDPDAKGVLLVCLGRATKLAAFLTGLEKEYVGRMKFGEETDTQDGSGSVIARKPVGHLTGEFVGCRMRSFLGKTDQEPPMFSAVKVSGKRLYRLARQGKVVAREPRTVSIEEYSLLRWEAPFLSFRVRCGSGTYVRTLCRDLGRACGSAGHMTELTRTAVGSFPIENSVTVEEIQDAGPEGIVRFPLIAPAAALVHLPTVPLGEIEAGAARHGRPVNLPAGFPAEGVSAGVRVKLVGPDGGLVAVGRTRGVGEPIEIERVFA
jgi:tRNA pseudouridine55 synthase